MGSKEFEELTVRLDGEGLFEVQLEELGGEAADGCAG